MEERGQLLDQKRKAQSLTLLAISNDRSLTQKDAKEAKEEAMALDSMAWPFHDLTTTTHSQPIQAQPAPQGNCMYIPEEGGCGLHAVRLPQTVNDCCLQTRIYPVLPDLTPRL